MILTFDLWSWTLAAYRLWCDKTLYQIWTQSSNPRRSYCDFNVWCYDLQHCVTCCSRLWDNFHHVWPSTTYPCLNFSFFFDADTLCHDVTLTFDPLTLKIRCTSIVTWSKSVRNLPKCTRIVEVSASLRKSGSRNGMVTSDFRPEVEIWPFRACAMKNMQHNRYLMAESPKFPRLIITQGHPSWSTMKLLLFHPTIIIGTVRSLRTWLWGIERISSILYAHLYRVSVETLCDKSQ